MDPRFPSGLFYQSNFISPRDQKEIGAWLKTIHPIWELRYSTKRTIPGGTVQRKLLRPVYWLGNWQFACLNYYRPPHGTQNRCVAAEPFPPVLARLVCLIERLTRKIITGPDLPKKWHLNTCLVNLYGTKLENEKKIDVARVGEHKDFEPGPVASLSLGERALFQFVESRGLGRMSRVAFQQWLENGSLQIFGGTRWKNRYFHRVQRVEKRNGYKFELPIEGFEARRVNFTFRYVPDEHIVAFSKLPRAYQDDVADYMKQLAQTSRFFHGQLN